jgi:hypothetical protein
MKRIFLNILFICFAVFFAKAQTITYSDYDRDDNRDILFEIIGKVNGNILVYKNIRKWKHRITVLDAEMTIKKTVDLDYVPEKTFNLDFVPYKDHFWMIYQYQKKSTLYCMAAKLDSNAQKIGEPIELDTTHIPYFADNKIYSTIKSEDKKHIMVFKLPKRNDKLSLVTMLYNENLNLQSAKTRLPLEYNDRKDEFTNFLLDNSGTLIFTKQTGATFRNTNVGLHLLVKKPSADTLQVKPVELNENRYEEAAVKIDNLNKRYIVNAFYYKEKQANIDGMLTILWGINEDSIVSKQFVNIDEDLRYSAKEKGNLKFALNDYYIKNIFPKKDGSFLLIAEDYNLQRFGNANNNFNRWDMYNYGGFGPSQNYYYYNPYSFFGGNYYRPYGSGFSNTRYFYDNILLLNFEKDGKLAWGKSIKKSQYEDENENFLSFSTFNTGGELNFLFNENNKYQIIANQSITAKGQIMRKPTIKTQERGYMFMPKLSMQVGATTLIIPCVFRSYICFAKVEL